MHDIVDYTEDLVEYIGKNTEGEVITDNEAYILRQCKGNSVDLELVGGSVAWNQLIQNGNFANTSGWSIINGTFSVSNNVVTINSNAAWAGFRQSQLHDIVADHKYFFSASVKKNVASDILNIYPDASEFYEDAIPFSNTTDWQTKEVILRAKTTTSTRRPFVDNQTANASWQMKNNMLIDLTALFGSSTIADYIYSLEQATAGAGVAWFRKYFPNVYYGYQSSKIESVNVASRKITGKNLLPMTLQKLKESNTIKITSRF